MANPRPEQYVSDDNPVSYLGFDPQNMFWPVSQRGFNFGNMIHCAGVDAAFNSVTNKRLEYCAALVNSASSYQNFVGKNWNADPSGFNLLTTSQDGLTLPSTATPVTHTISAFTLYAPNDQAFLRTGTTGFRVQGSSDNTNWTTLYSGTTAGTTGEVFTSASSTFVTPSSAAVAYPYHRLALQGDGINAVGLAQWIINVSQ